VEKWGAANAPSYTLVFRNTGILSTGLAIANVAPHATSVSAIVRNNSGAQIGTGAIGLPANGHTSFTLTDASSGGWSYTARSLRLAPAPLRFPTE
jgi:hypothetical protein